MIQSIIAFGITFFIVNGVHSMAVRPAQYAPRSVPGRIKSSANPYSIRDYLSNYLSSVRQQQQPQYGMPEYEPPYLNSYSNHQISPEVLSTLLPYLSQINPKDYSYDYNVLPSTTNNAQSWYDYHDANKFNMENDGSSQDAALLQLFLDHLEGKYSLEDLETLEREAAIEDNTENQLQSLMTSKKATVPVLNMMPSTQMERIPFKQGQKEEVIMLPATAIRRPIFARSAIKGEKTKKSISKTLAKEIKLKKETNTAKSNTKMEPMVKTAYNSLRNYLDRERMQRQAADEKEMMHTARKRFISEPKVLTEQLANLKKTIS